MEVEESNDEDGFHTVCNRKRKKASGTIADDGEEEQKLLSNNKFGPLADKNNNNNNAAPASTEAGKQKQPPLVVKNTSFSKLTTIVSRCNVKPVYKLAKFGIKTTVFSAEDFDTLRALLDKYKVEYYSHGKRSEQPHRVVLRGVTELGPEVLKDILKEEYGLEVLEVYAMKRKDEPTSVVEVPYVVLFPKGHTNLKKLSEINRMGRVIVRWEAYRNRKPHVTQCKNCLHLGHGAKNCHLKGRCNNCGGSHTTEKCQDQQAVRCANCAGSHAATDHSCPKRAAFIRSRQQASKPKPKTTNSAGPAFTVAEFPPLPGTVPVGESKSEHHRPTAAAGSGQDGSPREGATKGEAEEVLYNSAELWSIFTEFNSRLKRCMTRSDQVTVLGYMVCKYGGK